MYITCVPGTLKVRMPFLRAGVSDGWQLPSGHWEPNLGPVQEEQVILPVQPPLQTTPRSNMSQSATQASTHIWTDCGSCLIKILIEERERIAQPLGAPPVLGKD